MQAVFLRGEPGQAEAAPCLLPRSFADLFPATVRTVLQLLKIKKMMMVVVVVVMFKDSLPSSG